MIVPLVCSVSLHDRARALITLVCCVAGAQVYPLIAAMSFVTGMCVFQLTRNVFMNPDVRVSKSNRQSAVLDNADEGQRYSQHAFRRFLSTQRPEVFPALNRFFSESSSAGDK
jgi:hypothetical protein